MSTSGSTSRTAEPDLTKLLEQLHAGEIKLTDFQRGRDWDDSHIRSLFAHVSKSFPIGSVTLLETGTEGVRFRPRVAEGAQRKGTNPQQLILDGQRRMPTLYLALHSGKPVFTFRAIRKRRVPHDEGDKPRLAVVLPRCAGTGDSIWPS